VVHNWALSIVGKAVWKELQTITKSGLLQKWKMTVNEGFFLQYNLTNLTGCLHELALKMFQVFDAFSIMECQRKHMMPVWAARKEIVSGAVTICGYQI